jgi:hypothetical protein
MGKSHRIKRLATYQLNLGWRPIQRGGVDCVNGAVGGSQFRGQQLDHLLQLPALFTRPSASFAIEFLRRRGDDGAVTRVKAMSSRRTERGLRSRRETR